MKRLEQQEAMRNKIIKSAIYEFAQHEYNTASINRICDNAGISKGIIYHYFINKEALYLTCVEICIHDMLGYSMSIKVKNSDLQENIAQHMKSRAIYFQDNPEYKGLFFYAMMRTPEPLKKQIKQFKQEINKHTILYFKELLSENNINEHITVEYAIQFMTIQLNMFYEYFQAEKADASLDTIVEEYEKQVNQWLRIVLYGLIKEEK